MQRVQIVPFGDTAVLVRFGTALEQATVQRVWSAYAAISAALLTNVTDIVPAYGSILVRFDPASTNLATIMACVRGALENALAAPATAARTFRIGVCVARECALDLSALAAELKLSADEIIAEFCAASYHVAFLGFIAGFPYMLGLPRQLMVQRLATPRKQVPAGSVGIAAGQCGIYPRVTPGGWKILGRTAAQIFDPSRHEPAFFRPGDRVRFVPAATLPEAGIVQL